jgi:hypothetical protein
MRIFVIPFYYGSSSGSALANTGISPAFLRLYEVAYQQPFCYELGETENFSYSLFRGADLFTLWPRF